MSEQRKYDKEYKVEAVKLANRIGSGKAAEELGQHRIIAKSLKI